MLSRIQSLGCCLIVLTLLLFAGSAGARDVSPRCEASIDRAAGHYSKCLLSADASNARHKNPTKLANRQARCETRFDRRTSRAINRYGADECTSADLVTALADRTVTCAEGVSIEAGGEAAASLLYVQNADGGTLTETTLTLTGVSDQTGWFTDRPYREAGRMMTAEFVALFSEEEANSFGEDPPNADLTCESGEEVVNRVVTLTEPLYDEAAETLTYTAELVPTADGDDSFAGITCDADAHLFIDDKTTSVSTISCKRTYNCFVGAYCSHQGLYYPPTGSEYNDAYTNVYYGDSDPTAQPHGILKPIKNALAAGCNASPGNALWAAGHLAEGPTCLLFWGSGSPEAKKCVAEALSPCASY